VAAVRLLLDPHALLWWLFDDARLCSITRSTIADPENEVIVSAASAWEITTKPPAGATAGSR
jgi:PIN domain nuclease of toxin-antitoxin system